MTGFFCWKSAVKQKNPAIRGWRPFVLADDVWMVLAIGLAIQLHQKKV